MKSLYEKLLSLGYTYDRLANHEIRVFDSTGRIAFRGTFDEVELWVNERIRMSQEMSA